MVATSPARIRDLLFAAVLLCLPSLPAQCVEVGDRVLDGQLAAVLEAEGLVGLAWVLVDGSTTRTGSIGVRDNATGAAFTTDTRFHVGSVTKSLIATGILRLITAGDLELDAPVRRYLPELPIDNPWADEAPVTVRHLLDHTAGMDDARLWQMFSLRSRPHAPLAAAFPDPAEQLRVRVRPGSRFSYSNTGYTLLGMVIEAVTGSSYEQFLDERLLRPLGMLDSTFAFTTQEGPDADPSLAWGHVDDGSRYPAAAIFLRPAGQFTTTANDLVRYLRFLLGDGTIQGQTFLASELHMARGRPTTTEAARAGLTAGYGLGMARRDRHGVVGFCHPGNIVGFVAMLCIFPQDDKACAYSVNTDSETADYGLIEAILLRALAIDARAPSQRTAPAAALAAWSGIYVPSPNRFAMFAYLDELFGAVRLSGDSGDLVLDPVQGPPRRLRPTGAGLFAADDRATTSHVIYADAAEGRFLSSGFQTFERAPAIRWQALWLNLSLGLLGIAWFLGAGLVSLLRGVRARGQPERIAILGIMALAVPIPFFLAQSFMALGDPTVASVLLAIATVVTPAAAAFAGWRAWQRRSRPTNWINLFAAFSVLQWAILLAAHGLLPFRLWA